MEVAVKGKAKRRHLNANECEELGQSADVLTHPQTSNQGQSKSLPNRALHPKTPTKRRKHAPAESTSGNQNTINSFFPVTGVISSSPHKSPQPSTSTCSKEKVEEADDDEDDDVSLLAIPLEENDEIDDSLLADCVMPEMEASEAGATQEHEVDYLEGITAEMFDNDEDFESCLDGEDEVEALPDEHYGLLGISRTLVQPQGSIEDLPEEVLRQVLCLLPAQDLYRSACLVCHRWKNIVLDTKFMPYKKQYYRYMMGEEDTVMNFLILLRKHSIMAKGSKSHLSIRNLIIVMSQHEAGQCVSPDSILKCVQKHRLYPQAEASIRLRIPEIKNDLQPGLEGPNPYAAMAVILTLSECVEDVQALVSLLTDCLSLSAITEYLCHMATMLLALERNHILISNRKHYNIYYVLHLLENGPFSVHSGQSGRAQVHLTREQQQILSHNIQPDHVVKIMAFAGTGKTTTLVKYAEHRPHLRFLYVAFNSSVVREARCRFPSNVDCRTIHSLAYNDIGSRYRSCNKLTFNLKPFSINSVLPKGRGGFIKSKVVSLTLDTFMASADPSISCRHVPVNTIDNQGRRSLIGEKEQQLFVRDAQRIWSKMQDLNEKSMQAYYMTHDGYLKLWQLQIPKPRLSDRYDSLFIDEAQDCTPAIMDVIMAQKCGKILVGDPHQQIYSFKGAVNALQVVGHTHIYYLTQSFRFGAEIAYVGATILKVCKKVKKILVGGKQKGGVCDETADEAVEAMRTGVSRSRGQTAILSRCNAGVFTEAVQLLNANVNCRIHFVGDINNIGLDKIMDLWRLLQNSEPHENSSQQKYIKDPIIRFFSKKGNPFQALKTYVEHTEDRELESKVNIVEKYRKRIPELLDKLKQCHESDLRQADFIVGTVHKAKGLEFDRVMVRDDFVKIPSSRHNESHNRTFSSCYFDIPTDEWNLLYVAVTRARTSVTITKNISRILTQAGEYRLKSEMPSSSMSVTTPLPCSIENCPNCITPGSAFNMYQRPIKYTDGSSAGGPLCERCVWLRIGSTAFLMTDDVFSMAEIPQMFHRPMYNYFMGLHDFF
ncbi:F-box DNA helicase 1 [Gouania willdenowi]|uniref:F-box DNA helicase 1 n=1 Tax=Gouania willdenowi TaxID=441366 RepID=A0A8C5GB19_GOUWI|nr:F-box DNA helicase 1 [Gouania willdenowi]